MPSIESSFMCTRKHEDICGVGVPLLNNVGLQWPPLVSCLRPFHHSPLNWNSVVAEKAKVVVRGSPGVCEEFLRHKFVGFDGSWNVFLVNTNRHAHDHMLWSLSNLSIDLEKV